MALALSGPAAGDAVQLFTGDCLFPGGVGKTGKEGDFERLLGDVTTKVFDVYPATIDLYPRHRDHHTPHSSIRTNAKTGAGVVAPSKIACRFREHHHNLPAYPHHSLPPPAPSFPPLALAGTRMSPTDCARPR